MLYERYAIMGHLILFNFLQSVINNMADARTCKAGTALAAFDVEFCIDMW
jgi:hypothetical protein